MIVFENYHCIIHYIQKECKDKILYFTVNYSNNKIIYNNVDLNYLVIIKDVEKYFGHDIFDAVKIFNDESEVNK